MRKALGSDIRIDLIVDSGAYRSVLPIAEAPFHVLYESGASGPTRGIFGAFLSEVLLGRIRPSECFSLLDVGSTDGNVRFYRRF